MMPIDDICSVCDKKLIEIKLELRATMKRVNGKRAPNRYIFKSKCPSCNLYYRRVIQGENTTSWEAIQN